MLCFGGRLTKVEVFHIKFQVVWETLEFSQNHQVMELVAKNQALRDTMEKMKQSEQQISGNYRKIKKTMLELQARCTRDNLVVSGIPEQVDEDP